VAQFALLDQTKFLIYWIPVLPFLCIGIAAASWSALKQARKGTLRLALAAVTAGALLLVAAEGMVARVGGLQAATGATSYAALIDAAHEQVPAGSKVVGSTSLWWGFRDTDFRSYFLFFYLTRPDAGPYQQSISGFLREFDPDFLVLTAVGRGELQDHLIPEDYADLDQYLAENAELIHIVGGEPFKTYGQVEVWRFR